MKSQSVGSTSNLPQTASEPVREYPKTQKVDIQFTERTAHPKDGFCSPLTPFVKTWNTKMLFSKQGTRQVDLPHPDSAVFAHPNAAEGPRLTKTYSGHSSYSGRLLILVVPSFSLQQHMGM